MKLVLYISRIFSKPLQKKYYNNDKQQIIENKKTDHTLFFQDIYSLFC